MHHYLSNLKKSGPHRALIHVESGAGFFLEMWDEAS
jgi:hypothetical protein